MCPPTFSPCSRCNLNLCSNYGNVLRHTVLFSLLFLCPHLTSTVWSLFSIIWNASVVHIVVTLCILSSSTMFEAFAFSTKLPKRSYLSRFDAPSRRRQWIATRSTTKFHSPKCCHSILFWTTILHRTFVSPAIATTHALLTRTQKRVCAAHAHQPFTTANLRSTSSIMVLTSCIRLLSIIQKKNTNASLFTATGCVTDSFVFLSCYCLANLRTDFDRHWKAHYWPCLELKLLWFDLLHQNAIEICVFCI